MKLIFGSWLAIVAQYLNSFQCTGLDSGRVHQPDGALAQFILRNGNQKHEPDSELAHPLAGTAETTGCSFA
jgi:hypothetical protein